LKLVRLPSLTLAAAGALALLAALAPAATVPAGAQPAIPSATAAPPPGPAPTLAAPSPAPARGRRGRAAASPGPSAEPSPTATPTSPAYATLDGTWEVQIQYLDHTDYEFLDLTQQSNGALGGTFRYDKKPYALEGSYDGRLIRMVAKEPGGDVTLSGYVEGATDMVGLIDFGTGKGQPVAFTAEHHGPSAPSPRPRTKK
jgi:hypothetical protein